VKGSIEILGAYVDIQRILIIGLNSSDLSSLSFHSTHTRIGLAFRGIAQEEHTKFPLLGINPDRIASLQHGNGALPWALFSAIAILPLGHDHRGRRL